MHRFGARALATLSLLALAACLPLEPAGEATDEPCVDCTEPCVDCEATDTSGPDEDVTEDAVTLAWDPPVTNADGTTLTDLEGFRVYFGSDSPVTKSNGAMRDVGMATSTTLEHLPSGPVYATVTAYDSSGNESTYANELTIVP